MTNSFVRYCVAAAASFGMNLTLTWGLHSLAGTSAELAFAVALVAVILMNFVLARHFIYRVSEGSGAEQFVKYIVATAAFRGVEYGGFLVLHTLLELMYLVAAGAILAVSFVVKYLFYGSKVFIVH